MDVLTTAVEKINASVSARVTELRADRVALDPQPMIDRPWRIGRAMGDQPWHHVDEGYPSKLIRCRDKITKLEGLRDASHWAFNFDDLVALKQAEAALEILTSAAALTAEAA